jgi:DNA-binding SARP family transcriptional activator/TolB-like protein
MIEFRMLGCIDLRNALSVPFDRILSQPKRLALLSYLAAATPRGFHRRDTLLALFWPELDQDHARGALRNTIHFLRQELGPGIITSRGTDVGLSPEEFWSDVAAFESALKSGEVEHALTLYQGDFLKGVHLAAAPDFERWLDSERDRMRRSARAAACELSSRAEQEGDAVRAARWLRMALEVAPEDEVSLQRLMRLLDRSGDRAGALQAYTSFRNRLAAELEVEPSPESQGLVMAVRERTGSVARSDDLPARAPQAENLDGIAALASEPSLRRAEADIVRPRKRVRSVLGPVFGVAVVAAFTELAVARDKQHSTTDLMPQRVVVAPLHNRTGLQQLDALGDMAAEWITNGLIQADLVEVVSPTTARAKARSIESRAGPSSALDQARALAEETRAGLVVSGTYYIENDTLRWRAEIVDAIEGRLRADIGPILGFISGPSASIEELRGKVLGAVAALVDPTSDARLRRPHGSIEHVRSLEGQREFKEGLDLFLRYGEGERSLEHFYRAFAIDSMDAAALLEAAFVHWGLAQYAQVDSIVVRLRPSRNRMGEHDRLWFDFWSARIAGDRKRALEVNRQLVRLTPRGGWELQGGYQALSARRPREALAILQGGDPDKGLLEGLSWYFELQADALHVLSEHERELEVALRERQRHRQLPSALIQEVQCLAALGRIGELQTRIRESRTMAPQSALESPELSAGGIMTIAGAELRAHGNPQASRELFEQAVGWYTQKLREHAGSESLRLGLGTALYDAERWTQSRVVFKDLARHFPTNLHYRGYLGVLAARLGERREAARISDSLANSDKRYTFGLTTLWRARIAAQLGEPEKAMSLLNGAFADGLAFGIELHRDVDLEPLHSLSSFRELVGPQN